MDGSRSITLTDFLAAGFNFLPSVLFFISLAALALGWAPRLGKAVHGYLVFSFMLNYLSGMIDLPDWFLKTSIKSWIPHMPTEDFDLLIFVIITVISIADDPGFHWVSETRFARRSLMMKVVRDYA